jgi:hypothetical protein
MGMQMTDWNPAGSGGSQQPPTHRSHTKLWIGLGGGLALVVVIVVVAAVVLLKGPNVPAGTPNQYQLREILPSSDALPSGWRVTYRPQPLGTYSTAGSLPPRPINACLDFNNGFDLGIAGDTFVSLASETARNGSGFLRIDALGVLPGDAAKAISAVRSWARQCSAYSDGPVSYTVAAAPVTGLGSESLNVITTQQTGTPGLNVFDNDTLLPFHSGLPRAYYQTTPQGASYTDPPPYSTPARETCSKLPLLEGAGFITQDANFKVSAYVSSTDLNSDNLDIVLGEPATAALANADYTALAKLAAKCPAFSARQETYKTKVTSVAGLGEENIYIKMKPVAGNGLGAQYILLARVGDDGLVMVDCDMSAGDAPPSLVPIARAMVAKL